MALAARTGLDIITSALRELAVLGSNQTPSGSASSQALLVLNRMLDRWGTDRLKGHQITRNVHDLASGIGAYTIGSGATFNQERPTTIDKWSIIEDPAATDPTELPMRRPYTVAEWQAIPQKSSTSTYPAGIWYDNGFDASGFGTVNVHPVPDSSTPDIVLYTPEPLSGAALTLAGSYSFPAGYMEAIELQLALRLARRYGINARQSRPDLVVDAKAALMDVMGTNEANDLQEMGWPDQAPGGRGTDRYNIYSDGFG